MTVSVELPYKSPLRDVMIMMVNEKHGLGMKYDTQARMLLRIDHIANKFNVPKNTLTKELAEKWMFKDSNISYSYHKKKVDFLKQFAKYMIMHGYEAYLPNVSIPKSREFKPHIFSYEELQRLFKSADGLTDAKYSGGNPLKSVMAPVILRLAYCAGLRISEVCNLKVEDVDLKNGILHIKNAKFNKERLIPLTDEITMICREFSHSIHSEHQGEHPYFYHPRGEYEQRGIYHLFREVLMRAGISHGGKGKGPRFHDLRHTFAVNCLRKWISQGENVTTMLPYLAAYMGHTEWANTQAYLRLTAESFPSILEDMEEYAKDVIPELTEVHIYAK